MKAERLEYLKRILKFDPEELEGDMQRANAYCQQDGARRELAQAIIDGELSEIGL